MKNSVKATEQILGLPTNVVEQLYRYFLGDLLSDQLRLSDSTFLWVFAFRFIPSGIVIDSCLRSYIPFYNRLWASTWDKVLARYIIRRGSVFSHQDEKEQDATSKDR